MEFINIIGSITLPMPIISATGTVGPSPSPPSFLDPSKFGEAFLNSLICSKPPKASGMLLPAGSPGSLRRGAISPKTKALSLSRLAVCGHRHRPWLRRHLVDFVTANNFARRLKTLKGLTPHEYTC
jgi:hypothetical protein